MTAAMRSWVCSAAVLAGACGDNLYPDTHPIVPAADLTIVAHQDDDLIFMQPDLYDAVKRKVGVTNVYVTAGNGTQGFGKSEERYDGLMAAYGSIVGAGVSDWSCGWIRIGSNEVEHCRLESAKVSLVFMGYPDGGIEGEASDSLLHLWEGKVTRTSAVSFGPATYDRTALIAVLSDIIGYTQPTTIRTLEIASVHGYDHSDHQMAGALSVLAIAQSSIDAELISYRGYNTEDEAINANPRLYRRSLDALAYYEACGAGCAPCGQACAVEKIGESHLKLLGRRYAVGVQRVVDGKLRLDGRCLGTARASAVFVECAAAPAWHLDVHGNLMSDGGLCLHVRSGGELATEPTCDDAGGGAMTRFFFDDEGHLWSGAPPAPAADMALAHLDCLVSEGGQPRTALCGAGRAPRWEFARPMTATARATTAITRTGRAVRMARLPGSPTPALCAVEPARGLMCAPSTATGALLPAVRIDNLAMPLAIEPESLTLGDVDGDGLTDACGRDAGGILCATAAVGYLATRWSPMLGSSGPAGPTDRSLAIARGGKICGLDPDGVVCIAGDPAAVADVRSTWPDRAAALWIAELDGDGDPDWCAATPDGPACSLAADRQLATDGVLWGYSGGGIIEASARVGALPDTATAVLSDVDGDGRDDLCSAGDGTIACARSLSRGFGPRVPVARLPDGLVPDAVWAEPSKAPAIPRLCAADATTIACTAD
jgi:LmbE family N-acetylglucosaminyl deacetylase